MPFLGDCAVRHMGAVLAEIEASSFRRSTARRTAMPVVPRGGAGLDAEHQLDPWRPGRADSRLRPAGRRRWCRTAAGWSIDRRFLLEEDIADGQGRVERDRRAGCSASGAASATRSATCMEVLPLMTDRDAPVAAAVARAIAAVLGREPDYRGLARHLRPEAHRPHRPAAELRRLRAGHSGPRAPARRICRRRRHGRRGDGDGPWRWAICSASRQE